jgi:hypothetical protein
MLRHSKSHHLRYISPPEHCTSFKTDKQRCLCVMATELRIAGLHKQRLQPLDPGARTNDFASRITTGSNRTFVRLLNQICPSFPFLSPGLGHPKPRIYSTVGTNICGFLQSKKSSRLVLAQTSYLHLLSLLMQNLDFQA